MSTIVKRAGNASTTRAALAALGAFLLAPAAAAAQTGRTPTDLVRRAVQAMGGEEAVRGAHNTVVEFQGVNFGLGQEETPDSPPRANASFGRITTDWRGNRREAVQEFRGAQGQPIRTRAVTAGGIGMNANLTTGALGPMAAPGVANIERGMRLTAQRVLLAALDAPTALTALPPRTFRGETMDGVRYASGPDTLALYFDRPTGLLAVTEVRGDDPILGDRSDVTWYTRWQETSGVRLPRQIDTEVNGRLQSQTAILAVTVNAPLADSSFAIPDSIAGRAQRANPAPAPVVVTLNELAPGVWRAEGGSHHSLVIEQPDQLVVVEAPLNAGRARAVLDTLRGRFPGKRVGLVVATHHHWDHSGGVRAAMAAGVPVAAHRRNEAFLRRVAGASKTLAPDQLSRVRRAPALRLVDDSLTVGTGERRVVLYRLPTAHAEGLLAAYVPAAGLLFTSDVLSPGQVLAPAGSGELVAMARARGIRVERFAGGHGGVVPWSAVEGAAAR